MDINMIREALKAGLLKPSDIKILDKEVSDEVASKRRLLKKDMVVDFQKMLSDVDPTGEESSMARFFINQWTKDSFSYTIDYEGHTFQNQVSWTKTA